MVVTQVTLDMYLKLEHVLENKSEMFCWERNTR